MNGITQHEVRFPRFIGIDYSGAQTPTSSLPGLRVYLAEGDAAPAEVRPPPSPRKYWTRRGVAEWLAEQLRDGPPALVGIDHGFSFPLEYFQKYKLPPDWPTFLDDFQQHWPTDQDNIYIDFVRDGICGNGAARTGNRRWRRLCEIRAGAAKSVFFFDVQGSVAKSTHAGLPWLRYLRRQLGERVHFWPFDGWDAPAGSSANASTSGHSMAGTRRPAARSSPRCIPACGVRRGRVRGVRPTSMMPTSLPPGCNRRRAAGRSPLTFAPPSPIESAPLPRSKDGYLACCDERCSRASFLV